MRPRKECEATLIFARKRRTAQVVLGTALGLLGIDDISSDAAVRPIIQVEIERVTAAQGIQKPAWLGDADPLDYSRYKPRGFYAETPGLDAYFRAVSWLQSLPFRLDHDEEFLSILLLGNSIAECRFGGDSAKREQLETVFRCYRQLIGDNDDWDLLTVSHAVPKQLDVDLGGDGLPELRTQFQKLAARSEPESLINDQVRFPPSGSDKGPKLSFRILSAYRTPDAILFERTTNGLGREWPSGLEVCAALGSSFAEKKLAETKDEKLLATIRQSKELFRGSSLYFDYMHCVTALFDAPPASAPAFMSSEPWKIKSCQTALAGWAQLRHTWVLQAKENAIFLDGDESSRPAGFVEPNPAFFSRLASLIKSTETLLGATGSFALEKESPQNLVPKIRRLIEILKKSSDGGKKISANKLETPRMMSAYATCSGGLSSRQPKMRSKAISRPKRPSRC